MQKLKQIQMDKIGEVMGNIWWSNPPWDCEDIKQRIIEEIEPYVDNLGSHNMREWQELCIKHGLPSTMRPDDIIVELECYPWPWD